MQTEEQMLNVKRWALLKVGSGARIVHTGETARPGLR